MQSLLNIYSFITQCLQHFVINFGNSFLFERKVHVDFDRFQLNIDQCLNFVGKVEYFVLLIVLIIHIHVVMHPCFLLSK